MPDLHTNVYPPHTQICQIPPSAQRQALQVACSSFKPIPSSRRRLVEQIAYWQRRVDVARIAAEIVKIAVRGRHLSGRDTLARQAGWQLAIWSSSDGGGIGIGAVA